MAETTIYNSGDTLINRGLSMRTINNELTKLFQRYSMTLNKIMGDELIGNSQTREVYSDQDSVFKEYSKGQIEFKNGIDRLEYLLNHRTRVAQLIGADAEGINSNKRNLAKVKEYLNKLDGVCEIGRVQDQIQMYISKHDGNVGGLDSSPDWTDYILAQGWIDKLATKAAGGEYSPSDYRIEYLSDLIEGLFTDHIIDYHKKLDEFDPSDFLSLGKITVNNKTIDLPLEDAMNKLNSFGKLDYGFYELFKPIGAGNGRHVKVKMSTDGYVDVSGVVSLSDCEPFPWEYGSEAYLRSLNTGNQRYLLQLDMPLNDVEGEGSVLWWRPDSPEKLSPQDSTDEEHLTIRYYKPYEVERFLRWFGNDHVPRIDESKLEKCTVCSSPNLSDDTQSDNFHSDARNIAQSEIDLTRASISSPTSQSLLSLYPKATIAVRTYVYDETKKTYREPILEVSEKDLWAGVSLDNPKDIHQYIEFVVTGNRQTTNVSFDVRGWIGSDIQEKHHYLHTLGQMTDEVETLFNNMLFLEVCETIVPGIKTIWSNLNSDFWYEAVGARMQVSESWIPENWVYLEDKLRGLLKSPTVVDILRFRQLDMDTITANNHEQWRVRMDMFLTRLDSDSGFIDIYCRGNKRDKDEMKAIVKNKKLFGDDGEPGILDGLKNYIFNFKEASSEEDLDGYWQGITSLTEAQKTNLIKVKLEGMYGRKPSPLERKMTWMKFSSNGEWVSFDIDRIIDETTLSQAGLVYKRDEQSEQDAQKDYLLWLRKPYAIKIGADVTSIGDHAFAKCTSLTSVTIPKEVQDIASDAFSGCTNLTSIVFVDRGVSDVLHEIDETECSWGIDKARIVDIINNGDFADITTEVLRERITTYNNLIVRLPVSSQHNCMASKRIFQDWKMFVDGAVKYLADRGKLFGREMSGLGSDMQVHPFSEYYIDNEMQVPLVDYSWLYNSDPMQPKTQEDDVTPVGDRWDYWTEEDFKWPQ